MFYCEGVNQCGESLNQCICFPDLIRRHGNGNHIQVIGDAMFRVLGNRQHFPATAQRADASENAIGEKGEIIVLIVLAETEP